MDRASVDGIELEYEIRGAGEPVVLVHWGVCATWAEPFLDAPALSEGYRLLNYHRAGFGGSGHVDGQISMADHAEHCRRLMHYLGIERAHVVGHSSSAAIALQLALDFPEAVHTLTLLDAARPAPQTETQAAFARTVAQPAIQRYRKGDTPAAVDTILRGVFGPDYRRALDRGLPGAFDAGDRGRGRVLRTGAARLLSVAVRRARRAPRLAAGPARPRRAQRPDVRRTSRAAALLAAERRSLRPTRREPPPARRKPRRNGRGTGRLLRPPGGDSTLSGRVPQAPKTAPLRSKRLGTAMSGGGMETHCPRLDAVVSATALQTLAKDNRKASCGTAPSLAQIAHRVSPAHGARHAGR